MSEGWIILITAIITAVITIIGSLFFVTKQKPHANGNTGHSQGGNTFGKGEIAKLQRQIDEINEVIEREKRNVKRGSYASSVNTCETDFFSACSEFNDFDSISEWNNDRHENGKEDKSIKEILNSIDKKFEACYTDTDLEQLLNELEELCIENPEDVELLYRIGKIHVKLAEGKPEDIVTHHTEKGLKACETALKLNDKHAEAHKWYAILLGLHIQFLSLMDKAKMGILFKKHCDLAFILNPQDAMMHHLLGHFDFELAGLGWFEKKIAEQFFGNDLNSTYTEALNKFLTAERLAAAQSFSAKEKKMNRLMIGKCLGQLNRKNEAISWLVKAESLGSTVSDLDIEVSSLIQKYS